MATWVFASRGAVAISASLIAQLQLDSTRAAYGRIFASAPPPVFDAVLAEWRGRLGGVPATGQAVLVAVDGDRIVGVVVAGRDPMRPERGPDARFDVAPDRWEQGIGRRLYRAALAGSHGATLGEATLWVLERNDRARAWYERLGWRMTGEGRMVYEPAGIVELQYLIGLDEPPRAGDEVARYPSRDRSRAMTEKRSAGRVGDLLASRRRARFVGRAAESSCSGLALSRRSRRSCCLPPWTTGIGKTSLLEIFAGLAADAGAPWSVWTGATWSRRRRRCWGLRRRVEMPAGEGPIRPARRRSGGGAVRQL